MLSGWNSKMRISSPVQSRPEFVKKESQRGDCGIALHSKNHCGGTQDMPVSASLTCSPR